MKEKNLGKMKSKIGKKYSGDRMDPNFLRRCIKKVIKSGKEEDSRYVEIDDIFKIYEHLKVLENKEKDMKPSSLVFTNSFYFLKLYCQELRKDPSGTIFFEHVIKIWGKVKEIKEKYNLKSIERLAIEVYKLQRGTDFSPREKLRLLGELANNIENNPDNKDVHKNLCDDLDYYIEKVKPELSSLSEKETKELPPFLYNIYIQVYEGMDLKQSWLELERILQKIDEGQFWGKKIKKELIKKHFHLIAQEENDVGVLKRKHEVFRRFENDDSFPTTEMEKLEEMILDRDTSELESLEESVKYLNEFGCRWYIVLPKWLQKNDISIWEIIFCFELTRFLLDSSNRRTNKNLIFEQGIKEVIEQQKEKLQQKDALGLYLLLKVLAGEKIDPQIKLHIGNLITREVDREHWEKYKNAFMALIKN